MERRETKLQIFRAACCWENLGESSGGSFATAAGGRLRKQ